MGRLQDRQGAAQLKTDLDYSIVQNKSWDDLERIELLIQNMTAVKTEVIRSSRNEWLEQVQKIATAKGITSLLASPDTRWGKQMYAVTNMPKLLAYELPIEQWKAELFETVDASLTSTLGGIAETGSLVLWPDNNEPRLMSLVPPVHIAILEANTIEDTFWSFMNRHSWAMKGMPTNALLISGPSKTADIEQTLAYGVHGPKELVVIVV